MSRILVTGASGFVGQALCRRLLADGHSVVAALRSPESGRTLPPGLTAVFTKPLTADTDWSGPLSAADCVVHLAARVHVVHETASAHITAGAFKFSSSSY